MTSTIVEDQLRQFQNITHDQAEVSITTLPSQMVFEGREALKQIMHQSQTAEEVENVVVPLSRALGWAEALVFAFERSTGKETIRSLAQSTSPYPYTGGNKN